MEAHDPDPDDGLDDLESSWFTDDSSWAKLFKTAGFKLSRLDNLARAYFPDGVRLAHVKNSLIPASYVPKTRSSTGTPLRPKRGRKRLILAVAGSGWGKTSFKKGAEGTGLRVVDIDDIIKHDDVARDLRMKAASGKITWKRVTDYTHSEVFSTLYRIQPDVLLNHSGLHGVLEPLRDMFAVEEWLVTAPPLSDVIARVRARNPAEADKNEMFCRLNYLSLADKRSPVGTVARTGGSWTELWNHCLRALLKTADLNRGLSPRLLEVCESVGGAYSKRARRVQARAAELGSLGWFLYAFVAQRDLIDRRSIEADVVEMGAMRATRGEMALCAYSLLCMDFPVQVSVSTEILRSMLDAALVPLPSSGRPQVDILDKEARRVAYPLKSHVGAVNKVNVYANEVYSRTSELVPHLTASIREMTAFHDGFSDDQLSACIMYAIALNPHFSNSAKIATRAIRDPKGCKTVSNAFKSLGLNCHELGAMLVEAESLVGRGAVVPEAMEDAAYRLGGVKLEKTLHTIDAEDLRSCIRAVIERECPRDVEFESVTNFWERRWEWCVNGAHSKLIERLHPDMVPEEPRLKNRQVHRRVFAERLEEEPITAWDGKSYYTQSFKLECGKTRAIYSGDSLTYFAFEHLMKPVERGWKNIRAILDPGALGTWKVGKRIRNMRKKGAVNVMLDYDDFNSRHRLDYFRVVLEELCAQVNYPDALKSKLISSIYDGSLTVGGKDLGKVAGTLMSGHRCTTFFNTVLNEAYIRYAYPNLDQLQSMHVGDDVYISAGSYVIAQEVLTKCAASGLAMNPLKQSVGVYCAEFLRVAYGQECARGYVARSIATCVNGNWANDVRLNAEEGLKSIIGHSWTLCNRSCNPELGAVLVSSVKRICRISSSLARGLLTGKIGLGDGPCRLSGNTITTAALDIDMQGIDDQVALACHGLGDNATIDYLTYCASPLEQLVLGEIGGNIEQVMKCASYRKTMISNSNDEYPIEPATTRVSVTNRAGCSTVLLEEAGRNRPRRGYLKEYPLLQLVRKRMSDELLSQALAAVGSPVITGPEVEVYAWGYTARATAIAGTLTYSDACMMCSRADEDIIQVLYNCYA